MNERIKKERQPLDSMVRDAIIDLIKTQEFKNNKLPAESKLAKQFGVSVPVVREALALLRKDGIVTKKQGSGNYFHPSALNGEPRIDQYTGFNNLLHQKGYETDEEIYDFRIEDPEPVIRERLQLGEGEQVVVYVRIIYADKHPAVQCINYIPLKLFRTAPKAENMRGSLYDIFWNYLWKEMVYGLIRFYPYLTTEEDRDRLEVNPGRPMIIMEETYFSLEDIPMAVSRNTLIGEYITVNMLTRGK